MRYIRVHEYVQLRHNEVDLKVWHKVNRKNQSFTVCGVRVWFHHPDGNGVRSVKTTSPWPVPACKNCVDGSERIARCRS